MAKVIHYFPIEHIESRYTSHLDKSICAYLTSKHSDFRYYYPDMNGRESLPPPQGHFLNAAATCEFKARQLSLLASNYACGDVKDGDILFFSDIWFPGIEMIRYLDFFTRKKVQIRGLLHAGSFTDTDSVREMERWALHFETALFDICDTIYVASEFMKKDVIKKRIVDARKISVTPFPLDPALEDVPKSSKRNLVVFNGRNHHEKRPGQWGRLKKAMAGEGIEFIWTLEEGLDKEAYYKLLSEAKVVVSFAMQENFGFGILEAAKLGCIPVVPKRLVYPEHFDADYMYSNFDECVAKVRQAFQGDLLPPIVDMNTRSVERWFF